MRLISSVGRDTLSLSKEQSTKTEHTLFFLPDSGTWRAPVAGVITSISAYLPEVTLTVGADTTLRFSWREAGGGALPPIGGGFFLLSTVGQPMVRGQVIAHTELARYRRAGLSPLLALTLAGAGAARLMR